MGGHIPGAHAPLSLGGNIMRKLLFALAALCLGLAVGTSAEAADKTIRVGASPTPHAEILRACEPILKEQGYTLEIVEYADYVQPNVALESGELDANYFQHQPYLDDFNAQKGTHLVPIAFVHYEPFGIYAGRTKSLKDLKKGAIVSVPNDTTNEARGLLLLQANGLIKLKNTSLSATRLDIVENPLKLKIEELEAAQLVRSLPDVDIATINGNYALLGGLNAADALAVEASDSEAANAYANVLVVRKGDEQRPELVALAKALKSDAVKDYMIKTYKGAVLPK